MSVRRRTLLAALVVPLAARSCEPAPKPAKQAPKAGGEPPAPWEAQPDLTSTQKVITISAWLEPEFCPYYVKLEAVDHDTGEQQHNGAPGDDPRGERVTSGQYRHVLAYPSHHSVELSVHVTASKPGTQRGYVAVRDGRYRRDASFGGTAVSVLNTRTQR